MRAGFGVWLAVALVRGMLQVIRSKRRIHGREMYGEYGTVSLPRRSGWDQAWSGKGVFLETQSLTKGANSSVSARRWLGL